MQSINTSRNSHDNSNAESELRCPSMKRTTKRRFDVSGLRCDAFYGKSCKLGEIKILTIDLLLYLRKTA